MQDHTGINCPYVREITSLQERIPPGFAQDWGGMQQKVAQIHDAIYNSGEKGLVQRTNKNEENIHKLRLDMKGFLVLGSLVLLTYAGVIGLIIYLK